MWRRVLTVTVAAATLVAACTLDGPGRDEVTPGPVMRVAATPDPEGQLLAAILSELLRDAGFSPELVARADAGSIRLALDVGDADLAAGYTGQVWLDVLRRSGPSGDPRASFAQVRNADAGSDIDWLRPAFALDRGLDGAPANATFGMFTRGLPSASGDLRTMEQLATRLAQDADARVCVDGEFGMRPDGWRAVAAAYGIADRELTQAAPGEAIRGVAAGDCLVGLASATDGEAWHDGLTLLEDPLRVFPAFVVAVQMRSATLAATPELVVAFEPFANHLTTRRLGEWNGRVHAGEVIAVVAREAATTLTELRDAAIAPPAP